MRRHLYLKYLVTLIASTALTFHFLHWQTWPNDKPKKDDSNIHQDQENRSNDLYPDLRTSNAVLPFSVINNTTPGWLVLPGNVTVHSGRQTSDCNSTFTLKASKLCQDIDASKLSVLVFVASHFSNFDSRRSVRDTWGLRALQEALNFRVVFVLGQAENTTTQKNVLEESFRYGDIVQTNVADTFRNLGHKTVAGLRWVSTFCNSAAFFAKTDDDILLHIPNLMDSLATSKDPETMLLCNERRMKRIQRREFLKTLPELMKYAVSPEELPGMYYPPYCSGFMYAFSKQVRDRLLKAAEVTPVFFIEDVYLTGFCRYKAGVLITPHSGIALSPWITKAQAVCTFKEGRITSQEIRVDKLRGMWSEINTQGYFCPKLVGYKGSFPKKLYSSLQPVASYR